MDATMTPAMDFKKGVQPGKCTKYKTSEYFCTGFIFLTFSPTVIYSKDEVTVWNVSLILLKRELDVDTTKGNDTQLV